MKERRRILGELLLDRKLIDHDGLERALQLQVAGGRRIGQALLELGLIQEADLFRVLAFQLDLPFREGPLEASPGALARVRPAFARGRGVVPLSVSGREVTVAMADPLDLATLDDLQFQCGGRVRPVVAPPGAIHEALERLGRSPPSGGEAIGRTSSGAPGLVDRLILEAAEARASDLHIEPSGAGVTVRVRIDGILRPVPDLPATAGAALLSRLKVLGEMDIAVKLRPQDGGFTFRAGSRTLNIRVSTLPVEGGEKAVLRLLDPSAAPASLDEVGLVDPDLGRVRAILGRGSGVILTAGPTGSGKSSTLSAAIAELDREGLNVVTLEDPVEYRLPGVSQVEVHPRAGLTFPAALRATLRQDPDVVMVGEIRDRETAEIAMAAAVTGHLVLSTIHTIDAPSGITRLLHMDVPPYLVAGGLAGIVSQRLVRRVCPRCGGRYPDCGECPDGYRGRTGIFQVLTVTEALREEIVRRSSTSILRRRARAAGMGSMADDARRKVAEGITSPHEVARVLREDPGEAFPCRRCGAAVPPEANGCPHCGHPSVRLCGCGERLREGWRFCATCLRPTPPTS